MAVRSRVDAVRPADQVAVAGALGEVGVPAAQYAVDQLHGGLRGGDAATQLGTLLAQDAGAPARVGRVDHLMDLVEAEPGPFAAQDGRHPVHVMIAIPAPSAGPFRGEQPHRLPVPQHVRRQPEPLRDVADPQNRIA